MKSAYSDQFRLLTTSASAPVRNISGRHRGQIYSVGHILTSMIEKNRTSSNPCLPSGTRISSLVFLYLALTAACTTPWVLLLLHAQSLDIGRNFVIHTQMWAPALAAFTCCAVYRIPWEFLGFRWPGMRAIAWGYLLPVAYATTAYLFVCSLAHRRGRMAQSRRVGYPFLVIMDRYGKVAWTNMGAGKGFLDTSTLQLNKPELALTPVSLRSHHFGAPLVFQHRTIQLCCCSISMRFVTERLQVYLIWFRQLEWHSGLLRIASPAAQCRSASRWPRAATGRGGRNLSVNRNAGRGSPLPGNRPNDRCRRLPAKNQLYRPGKSNGCARSRTQQFMGNLRARARHWTWVTAPVASTVIRADT